MTLGTSLRWALAMLLGLTLRASEPFAARWEGIVQIPGRDLRLVIDLAQDGQGKWVGSATVPGFGIKGAPLADLSVRSSEMSFAIKGGLGDPILHGHLTASGELAGAYEQAGNKAPFVLQKSGQPQVEAPRESTPVRDDLEGEWMGEMTVFGNKITIKLKLANQASGRAGGQFTLIGKHETVVPIDLVTLNGNLLTVELFERGITYEGQFRQEANEIAGEFLEGPLEVPLILRPAVRGTAAAQP